MLLASLNKSNVTKTHQPAATGPKDKLPPNIFYADVAQLNVYKKDLHKHSTCVKHQRWLQKYNCLINLFFIEFPYDDKADFWLYTRENWSSTTPTPPPLLLHQMGDGAKTLEVSQRFVRAATVYVCATQSNH